MLKPSLIFFSIFIDQDFFPPNTETNNFIEKLLNFHYFTKYTQIFCPVFKNTNLNLAVISIKESDQGAGLLIFSKVEDSLFQKRKIYASIKIL